MKSALFVDFDNVYTALKVLQPAAAERFGRYPADWIRWMVDSLAIPEGHEPTARRRLLVRRCYLNPSWYQNYRSAFLRAGFEIVDCPPVTSQGKTSTDIHMVLDIVELLQHETRYEEFILLSADADFSPVLRKLRRYDRRTSVLAIGFPSAAYQASADLLIDERVFVEKGLGLPLDPDDDETPAVAQAAQSAPASSQAAHLSAEQREEIGQLIQLVVAQSTTPVTASLLAARLRQTYGAAIDDWDGHENFRPFFLALELPDLVWLPVFGGRIADPTRHTQEPDGTAPDAGWADYEALHTTAREVAQLTGAPLWSPPTARAVLEELVEDLCEQPFDLVPTAQRVRARCAERSPGIDVSIRDVIFTLRGMQFNGHAFGRGIDDGETLAGRLCNQVLFLCQREGLVVDEGLRAQVRQWLGGEWLAPA